MTKLDAGLMTSLPASDPGSTAVWGSKRINPRPQSCLCLTWSGYPSNDDDDDDDIYTEKDFASAEVYDCPTVAADVHEVSTFDGTDEEIMAILDEQAINKPTENVSVKLCDDLVRFLFMDSFSLLTLLCGAKFSSWLAVPPIIIRQTSHVIQSLNLFDNIIIIYSFFFLIYIFICLRCCGHAFYCFILSLSDYLKHVLTSDVVLLLSFFYLSNIYNFCAKLFDND